MRALRSSLAVVAAAPVLFLGIALGAAAPAGAVEVADAGWWWRLQGDGPVAVPAPPNVPEGGLAVQLGPGGPLAVGAVRFTAEPGSSAQLTLRFAEAGSSGAENAAVHACPASAPWTGGDARPWSEQPTADCTRAVAGSLGEDGSALVFELGTVADDGVVDVVVAPASADGAPFSLAFQPPAPEDLDTDPAVASPAAVPFEAGPAASAAPSVGASPGGTRPALVPARTSPAVPPVSTAPPVGDETAARPAPSATVPAFGGLPTAAPRGMPSAGELLPLLLVLALGPAAVLATRHPRVAALVGTGASRPAVDLAASPFLVAPGSATADDEAPVAVLQCRDVAVRFGGLQALGGVDLEVYEGEIVGLIGPNGAGKTTLMECISGFQRVTGGRITYRGEDLLARGPSERAALGIGRTLQNVRLFPYLTVLDNVRVALHRHQSAGTLAHAFRLPSARDEERRLLEEAERIVALVGMEAFAEKFASELSYGTLRLLELACMLALKPSFLLLDEPASGISQKETEALGPLLRRIQAATGATILMIEHDMPLVMGLSDRVYCLDAGSVLSTGTPQQVQDDPKVAEAYLGTPAEQRKVAIAPNRPEDVEAELLLDIQGLDVFYDKVQVLYGVDVHVRRGERVALLGTNGAGKSTILKAASGLVAPAAGTLRWKGEDITDVPAERLVRMGLGQVPGGRGLFPTLTVGENLRMGGYIYPDDKRIDEEVERVLEYFPWIADRTDQPAGTLSGGEQQQLATARALMSRPELLMIDELSLGLAPLVIERLMDTVQRLCDDEGLTVVIVEQQASFALGYTDRAYFLEKGEVRYAGPSAGLTERGDLLRSVFLAGATAGFAASGSDRG